jgi:hypothetical protein
VGAAKDRRHRILRLEALHKHLRCNHAFERKRGSKAGNRRTSRSHLDPFGGPSARSRQVLVLAPRWVEPRRKSSSTAACHRANAGTSRADRPAPLSARGEGGRLGLRLRLQPAASRPSSAPRLQQAVIWYRRRSTSWLGWSAPRLPDMTRVEHRCTQTGTVSPSPFSSFIRLTRYAGSAARRSRREALPAPAGAGHC